MEMSGWPDYLPPRHNWSEPFWLGLDAGELQLSYCPDCKQVEYPPLVEHCRECNQPLAWKPASGKARLWSWTTFHRVYYPDYPLDPPYTVLMVDLEEGVRMLATLSPDIEPDNLECDQVLQFIAIEIASGILVPGFKP